MAFVKSRDTQIGYDDVGDGLPVVLLHAFPLNRAMWHEQIAALSSRWRFIAPDHRGFGESSVAPSATMEEMAQDVAALLDELQIEQAVIGGLSMGGYVSFAFYRQFPQRVRALILADTRAEADTEEARRNRERMAERALREGAEAIAEEMIPKLVAARTLNERPEIRERLRLMIVRNDPAGIAAAQRGMAVRRDQTDLLARIEVPTLIIVGCEDQLTPPELSEAMHQRIRGSHLVAIEGAGHVSNIERPQDFNRALESFLQRIEPKR
ncbi:MAG: alpha/beta hydrolase [Pyrinomonas sp.]|uniref:alpha/beta fold hydrolase n=1 Tax=Pyrinomonas sp. TaxID=2080306 RepID=UPI00332BA57A